MKRSLIKKFKIMLLISVMLLILFFLGIGLNNTAVIINHGKMPVYLKPIPSTHWMEAEDYIHFGFLDKSEINGFLIVDIFQIKIWGYWAMWSLGDFLLYIAGYGFLGWTLGTLVSMVLLRHKIREEIWN